MNPDSPSVSVIMLGSGTSHGIPMIGCTCDVCTSKDPKDKRTRASIYVVFHGVRFLVDTAPELRLQCVDNGIDAVDAVLFTHAHADHILGLDDLRRFNWLMQRPIACYGSARTLDSLKRMFAYAFEHAPDSPHSRPHLELHEINENPFTVGDATVQPIPLFHGPMPVLGFRFGPFAYCTDCNRIPDSSIAALQGIDVLILDALRKSPHPAHFTIEEAIAMSRRINPKRTFFTHMTHQLPHASTNLELPDGIELGWDGLRIEA